MTDRVDVDAYLQQLLQPQAFKDYGPNGLQVEGRRRGAAPRLGRDRQPGASSRPPSPPAPTRCWCTTACSGAARTAASPAGCASALARLLAHDINLFAYHLPLDAHAELGNNAQLGRRLGLVADARFGEQDLGFIGPPAEPPSRAGAGAARAAGAGPRALAACRATAGRCAAWPGAPAARRATSRPPSPPAPMPSSPARCPSRRPTWRARPAWPSWPAATTPPSATARRRWRRTWPRTSA